MIRSTVARTQDLSVRGERGLAPGTRLVRPYEALRLDRRGGELTVLDGGLWLTRSKDPTDYFVASGESIRVSCGELVVIETVPTGRRALVHWQPTPRRWLPFAVPGFTHGGYW